MCVENKKLLDYNVFEVTNMVYQLHRDNEEYFRFGRCLGNLHFHRAIEIIYCIQNPKPVIVGGNEIVLNEGELLFIPPLVSHMYPPIKVHKSLCVVMPVAYSDILKANLGEKNFCEFVIHDKEAAKDIFTHLTMLENCNTPLLKQSIYTYTIARALSILKTDFAEDNKKEDFTINVLKYIEKNHNQKLTSKSVATALGYNHCYFSSLFNQNFKMSFSEYLNMVRINKAARLISSMPIKEAAFHVGFSNPQSFYQNFRKIMGASPAEYLNKNKSNR